MLVDMRNVVAPPILADDADKARASRVLTTLFWSFVPMPVSLGAIQQRGGRIQVESQAAKEVRTRSGCPQGVERDQ